MPKRSLTEEQKEAARERSRKHYYVNREKKLAYQRKYYQDHIEERVTYSKKYREDNKEKIKANKQKYQYENREKLNAISRKYYQDNIEEQRKWHKEYARVHAKEKRARAAKWYAENPERGKANARVAGHKRRARITKVGGAFTKEDIRNLYATQGARCYYCSDSIENGYHIEHMTPICRGGTNGPENLCLACAPCNSSKATKTAEEFMNVC